MLSHVIPRRYFAVGTRPPMTPSDAATVIARVVAELIAGRNRDGTWGGPDGLDQLISTCHVTMTLMAAGVSPGSETLRPGLEFLAELDTDRHTTFYWRSGPLLNVRGFEHIVEHDVAHMLRFKDRSGGNPSYPAPFFLLKLIRFSSPRPPFAGSIDDIVQWIVSEWSHDSCWYGRTSITSMGLALIADLGNVSIDITNRAVEYLVGSFQSPSGERPRFSDNVIDDAFTVYNLYERYHVLKGMVPNILWQCVEQCADGLVKEVSGFASSPPPFGGAVDSRQYGQAVLARAIMARQFAVNPQFDAEFAVALMNANSENLVARVEGVNLMEPFWGSAAIDADGSCFVLMPFSPRRRTEIYEEYIKRPLRDQLGVPCRRADDFYASRQIMDDVWKAINRASFIVADLSGRNPNVFYELGLAHVVGKPVILVAEAAEDIPFDLQGVRTIVYGDSPGSWRKLATQIVEYARPLIVR